MKNPWMSLWLSAANKAAGPVRGAAFAQIKRNQTALTKQLFGAAVPAGRRARPKRKKS
jgi:hypothetical protein